MQSLVGDVRAVVEEVGPGEPAVVGHSLGASIVAVYAAAPGARTVVCVDQSLRFGEFAALVQARADDLRSPRTMEAVVSIDRALKLEPYADVEELERRVLAFPREVVLGIWGALLNHTSRATDRNRRGPAASTFGTPAVAPRLAATTRLRELAGWPRARRADRDLGGRWPHAPPRPPGTVCGTRPAATQGPSGALSASSDRSGPHGRDSSHAPSRAALLAGQLGMHRTRSALARRARCNTNAGHDPGDRDRPAPRQSRAPRAGRYLASDPVEAVVSGGLELAPAAGERQKLPRMRGTLPLRIAKGKSAIRRPGQRPQGDRGAGRMLLAGGRARRSGIRRSV